MYVLLITFFGVVLFSYSFICYKNKKPIFTVKSIYPESEVEFVILDNRYFPFQFKICMVNLIIFLIGTIAACITNKSILVGITLIVYWFITYIFKKIVIRNQYAKVVKKTR